MKSLDGRGGSNYTVYEAIGYFVIRSYWIAAGAQILDGFFFCREKNKEKADVPDPSTAKAVRDKDGTKPSLEADDTTWGGKVNDSFASHLFVRPRAARDN